MTLAGDLRVSQWHTPQQGKDQQDEQDQPDQAASRAELTSRAPV